MSVNNGKDFESFVSTLRKIKKGQAEAYKIRTMVLNAKDYGSPQSRARLFFIGIRKDIIGEDNKNEEIPIPPTTEYRKLQEFLDPRKDGENPENRPDASHMTEHINVAFDTIKSQGGDRSTQLYCFDCNVSKE